MVAGINKLARGADRDDDERDLKPFEQDSLEAGQPGQPIEPYRAAPRQYMQLRGLCLKNSVLIVQRDYSSGSQDRLAQPAHAEEQQQDANHHLQRAERHKPEQRPERRNDRAEQQENRAKVRTEASSFAVGDGRPEAACADRHPL